MIYRSKGSHSSARTNRGNGLHRCWMELERSYCLALSKRSAPFQTIMRGAADDLALLDWLSQRIWPFEAAHDERSLKASAQLGLAELIRGGTTTLLTMETVHQTDVVFDEARRSGLRAIVGKCSMNAGNGTPKRLLQPARQAFFEWRRATKSGTRLRRVAFAWRWRRASSFRAPRACCAMPTRWHANWECSFHTQLRRTATRCDRCNNARAVGTSIPSIAMACCTIAFAWRTASGPVRANGVCCVRRSPSVALSQLEPEAGIGHCTCLEPTPGGVSSLSVPMALPATTIWICFRKCVWRRSCRNRCMVLRSCRYNGPGDGDAGRSESLGLDKEIGSLEVGKRADVIAVNLKKLHSTPHVAPVSALVYSTRSSDVETCLVDGRILMKDKELLTMDHERILRESETQFQRLSTRIYCRADPPSSSPNRSSRQFQFNWMVPEITSAAWPALQVLPKRHP